MSSYESTMLKLEKMAQANTATQMNWQEKMSKTSHQMEVDDLIAAGLNPVLSANSGANAYTTSVDSAVNGIASMASAKQAADATRFAARQSAAATRAAAAAQLSAAQYSADKAFDTNKYSWDSQKEIQASKNQTQLEIVDKTPPKSLSGLIWKCIDQSGLRPALMQPTYKTLQQFGKYILNNADKIFKNNDAVSRKNFVLSKQGKNEANSILSKLGLNQNNRNRNLLIKFLTFNSISAGRALFAMMPNPSNASAVLNRYK